MANFNFGLLMLSIVIPIVINLASEYLIRLYDTTKARLSEGNRLEYEKERAAIERRAVAILDDPFKRLEHMIMTSRIKTHQNSLFIIYMLIVFLPLLISRDSLVFSFASEDDELALTIILVVGYVVFYAAFLVVLFRVKIQNVHFTEIELRSLGIQLERLSAEGEDARSELDS